VLNYYFTIYLDGLRKPPEGKTCPGSRYEAQISGTAHISANFRRAIIDHSNENCLIVKLKTFLLSKKV
jgi:hypothetical protein